MEPFEVMTSESQERMLAIVEPDKVDAVLDIARRWEVRATVIGVVTGTGRLRVLTAVGGEVLADAPAKALEEEAPLYDRPRAEPADLVDRRADGAGSLPPPDDAGSDLMAMLADTSWVWSQYDHMLFLNTVVGPGGDAAVLRLKHPTTGVDTGRGLALTTDGNHLWCAVDPRAGAAMTVSESVMNLAVVGARPVAMVNCLNFGNPEHPEVMWQLSETVDGMTEALDAFGVPCVGGNVSLYNESRGSDIDPTPVIGVLGMVDRLDRRPPGVTLVDGGRLVLVGPTVPELSGIALGRDPRPSRPGRVAAVRSGDGRAHRRQGPRVGGGRTGARRPRRRFRRCRCRAGGDDRPFRRGGHRGPHPGSRPPVLRVRRPSRSLHRRRAVAGGVRRARRGGGALLPHRRRRGRSIHDQGTARRGRRTTLSSSWRNRLPDALGAGTTQG